MINMLIKERNYLRDSWEFYMITSSFVKSLISLSKSVADRLALINWRSNIHFFLTSNTVEFRRSAFIDEQLKKLDKFIDSIFENSLFVAIYRMYFFFFICEMKCDAFAFNILSIVKTRTAWSLSLKL